MQQVRTSSAELPNMSTLAELMDDNGFISSQPCNSAQFWVSSELPKNILYSTPLNY